MKVLLVNGGFGMDDDNGTMQLTMYALGAYVREHGHKIEIIDPDLYLRKIVDKDIIDDLVDKSNDFDVVAFSINSFTWGHIKHTISRLRDNGYHGIIVVGGVHATQTPKHVMEVSDIDYVLIGEGEISLPMLIDAIQDKKEVKDIPGVIYRNENNEIVLKHLDKPVTLDEHIALPAYDLVPDKVYNAYTFESSRGCSGNCSFCSIIYKKCWRGYGAEATVRRLLKTEKTMRDKVNKKAIDLTDDHFFGDIPRAKEILLALKDTILSTYSITLEAKLKVFYDLELCKILKNFRYLNIQVGVESGYDIGLMNIRKGILLHNIFEVSKILLEQGLNKNVFFSFIVGFPWETKEQIYETLRTAGIVRSKYLIPVNLVWWLPLPSAEFEILKKMDSSFTYDIYDDINWVNNKTLFEKCRPLISAQDISEIDEIIKTYNRFGYNLRIIGASKK